jgi:hypothetical protein
MTSIRWADWLLSAPYRMDVSLTHHSSKECTVTMYLVFHKPPLSTHPHTHTHTQLTHFSHAPLLCLDTAVVLQSCTLKHHLAPIRFV